MRISSRTAIARTILVSLTLAREGTAAANAAASRALESYLAAHPIQTRPAVSFNSKQTISHGVNTSTTFNSVRNRCPAACSETGSNPRHWTVYHDVDRLAWCNDTMLLDFALYNPLDDPSTHARIRACTADLNPEVNPVQSPVMPDGSCFSRANQTRVQASLQLAWSDSSHPGDANDVVAAAQQMATHLTQKEAGCNETIAFAYSGQAALGLYAGSGISSQGIVTSVLRQFTAQVQSKGISDTVLVQLCGGDTPNARYAIGIVANANADLASVQSAVKTWRDGKCIIAYDGATPWQNITFLAAGLPKHTAANSTRTNSTLAATKVARALHPRETCSTVQVVSGDSCASLAAECGISASDFTAYNPNPNLCSTLAVGQYVCCSPGTLPDFAPQPDANGTCASYLVQAGDSCSEIAAKYSLTVAELESYNNDTWAWMGCDDLQVGNYICLSTGYPPMPAIIPNAVCGPQVNGTAVAPPGTDLSLLNECPLNACCDIWGQCGTTAEFCTKTNSSTGAPGTAAPGTNGCISNCGTEVWIGAPPDQFMSIGYFEAFDWSRPCLTMAVTDIDVSKYTHIHLAFATITPDFDLNITAIQDQFDMFVGMSGVKRIISIGGWDFSTSPDTYMIFREAVQPANRVTLMNNVINFLNQYDLDGVDWDWEYPGEPDIPGIPPSSQEDALNYFVFLDALSTNMSAYAPGKTLSVTAPASYWYLKNIPIVAINAVVDYIIYMTYDLHGQWDYGNAFSDAGCPAGNCLRSDVNLTETINALSMITKAGIPSNKVVVGVTSYGRSFQMTEAGCYTEMCTFTGPQSGAFPGPCTNTAGYLANAEIDDIIAENSTGMLQYLDDSYSNILVYDDTQWVSYMDDSNKAVRALLYKGYNFAGTVDWAIDLQSPGSSGSGSSGSDNSSGIVYIGPEVWTDPSPEVTCIPPCSFVFPPLPLSTSTTITFPSLTTQITYSSRVMQSTTLWGGNVTAYPSYVTVTVPTVIPIPPLITDSIPVWGVTITSGQPEGPIYLTSSVEPPPFPVTITPTIGGSTSISGGTATTSNGTTAIWGSFTWIADPVTETFGGSTTVVSGTTLPPVTTMITPHPYPTTTTDKPDPSLNTASTSWKSGGPPGPTCTSGCGSRCWLFCHSSCPLCPPGFGGFGGFGFGSSGPGSSPDEPGNPDSSASQSESTSSEPSDVPTNVAGFAHLTYDPLPTTTVDSAVLSSLQSSLAPVWSSLWSRTATATATTSAPAATTSLPGLILAAYTSCASGGDPCTYAWDIYPLNTATPVGSVTAIVGADYSTIYAYPGCTTTPPAVLYASSVASNPTVTAMPTLGPFSMDGFSGSCSMVPEFSYGGQEVPALVVDCDDSQWGYDTSTCVPCYPEDNPSGYLYPNQYLCSAGGLTCNAPDAPDMVESYPQYYCYFEYSG